jgi:glucose/mannose-6-phosphate isomerase
VATELVATRGNSRLARLFSLVQLGDYASCYLALLYGVDPTPVDAIQTFKASLADDGG